MGAPGRPSCLKGFEPGPLAPTLRCIEVSKYCDELPDKKCHRRFAFEEVTMLTPKLEPNNFTARSASSSDAKTSASQSNRRLTSKEEMLEGVCLPAPQTRDCPAQEIMNGLIMPANLGESVKVVCDVGFKPAAIAQTLTCIDYHVKAQNSKQAGARNLLSDTGASTDDNGRRLRNAGRGHSHTSVWFSAHLCSMDRGEDSNRVQYFTSRHNQPLAFASNAPVYLGGVGLVVLMSLAVCIVYVQKRARSGASRYQRISVEELADQALE